MTQTLQIKTNIKHSTANIFQKVNRTANILQNRIANIYKTSTEQKIFSKSQQNSKHLQNIRKKCKYFSKSQQNRKYLQNSNKTANIYKTSTKQQICFKKSTQQQTFAKRQQNSKYLQTSTDLQIRTKTSTEQQIFN